MAVARMSTAAICMQNAKVNYDMHTYIGWLHVVENQKDYINATGNKQPTKPP